MLHEMKTNTKVYTNKNAMLDGWIDRCGMHEFCTCHLKIERSRENEH